MTWGQRYKNAGLILAAAFLGAFSLGAEDPTLEDLAPPAPPDNRWRFSMAVTGWLANFDGKVGVNGRNAQINLGANDILRSMDMVVPLRAELSKGRFGVTGEFIYLGLSGDSDTNTVVRKIDLQADQIIGDLGLRWRFLEGPAGHLDVIGGVRYMNFYQEVVLKPNTTRINQVSSSLVDEVGNRLSAGLSEAGLVEAIERQVGAQLNDLEGRDPRLPIAPLAGGRRNPLLNRIQRLIDSRKAELATAVQQRVQAATAALQAEAQARVDAIKQDLSNRIAGELQSSLDTTASRVDDWFDPYIGLRGRLNWGKTFYLSGKGDVGGFGIGSELTWQGEAAIGCKLTSLIFAELGYRALAVNYEDELVYDSIIHGPQITVGVHF